MINGNDYEIIINRNYIHIKNYNRIIDICDNRIKLVLNNNIVLINGNCLIVCAIDEYEIVIKGYITSIEYINE